ncbi:MAG: hypothetical protein AB7S26_28025 [Sandaracinaceae bacterium]
MDVALIAVTATCLVVLFWPKVRRSTAWRATVTPLASIIGSGFLILGPILIQRWGRGAPIAMLVLCGLGFVIGSVIRFNIRHLEPRVEEKPRRPGAATNADSDSESESDSDSWLVRLPVRLEKVSSFALSGAYLVSVTYYLNLFGSFLVEEIASDNTLFPKIACTAAFVLIAAFGAWRGLDALEHLEIVAVGIKLSIIAALLVGLGIHATELALASSLPETAGEPGPFTEQLVVLGGLLVTVQGFETSRYLGEEYDAEMRVRTMRNAQLIASGIYLTYATLVGFATHIAAVEGEGETAIIGLSREVSTILPMMLVVAALASQLSAAIADTNGGGGLIEELSKGRVKSRSGYVLMCGVGIALTWTTDVFEIIALASRAFASYYALQCAAAAALAGRSPEGVSHGPLRAVGYGALALLCVAIAIFGVPAE